MLVGIFAFLFMMIFIISLANSGVREFTKLEIIISLLDKLFSVLQYTLLFSLQH